MADVPLLIAARMAERDITARELAQVVGVPASAYRRVYDWRAGRETPKSPDALLRLAEHLGIAKLDVLLWAHPWVAPFLPTSAPSQESPMPSDPYGRPTLVYRRVRQDVVAPVDGGPSGWRGRIEIGGRAWPTIENAEARAIPAGRCFGIVRMRGDGQTPCLWLTWGDPDGGEEHQVHAANAAAELRGCIAPGMYITPVGVGQSRDALGTIFAALVAAASYGEWTGDDGARVSFYDPPLGLVVVIEVIEAPAIIPADQLDGMLVPFHNPNGGAA